jgi:hypothetical protein
MQLVYNVLINGVSIGLTKNLREARSWCIGRTSEARIVTIKDEVNYAS